MMQPMAHTSSYYAATLNDATEYPSLNGDHRADVCVIGAGFTGISTALSLAERGYNVRVIEANKVGWGASGRNGGQMIGGISGEGRIAKHIGESGEDLVWAMRWAGHEIIRERVKTYNIICDLKHGYLDVAIKDRHVRALHEDMEALEKYNFPHKYKLLSKQETENIIGTKAYIGALQNMGNGHLHPLNLCLGEARAAASKGVMIHENTSVINIEKSDKPKVISSDGSVTADFVVLAGNAYHFLDRKLRGMLLPVNSFIIATEPLSKEIVEQINPMDLAVCDPNYVLEYFRLSADKRLLFGGRCNYSGSNINVIKKHLFPRMLKIYPQLKGVNIDYAWGGTIGVTVNRVPQIGRIAPNIFYSQGYSGHGVNVTHVASQILADAITGTFEHFDILSSIKPIVIPGTPTFGKQMVSLGMLFYLLKDKL